MGELETVIMAHPKVLEAAVFAIPHVKYQERPIAVVTPLKQHEHDITRDEIYKFLESRVSRRNCKVIE